MKKLVILLLAGLMFLPTAFMGAVARPTVINVNYHGYSGGLDKDITFKLHALGFPGEELDWSGTLVIPANQETQPSWVSSIVMTSSSYTETQVSGQFLLADSTNPDFDGCNFKFSANTYGDIWIQRGVYNPNCGLNMYVDAYWAATVVINM
jgi:hypothetical protein